MGHHSAWFSVHLGAVFGNDFDRLQPIFQTLYDNGYRTYSFCQLRGTALQQHRHRLPEKLCRYLSGRLCDCFGLRNFLRFRFHAAGNIG